MTNYTINGDVVQRIEIMVDGKRITIIPHDFVAEEDIILFPQGGKGGEFTHDMPIIGHREQNNIYLVTGSSENHDVNYSPNGEGDPKPLIRIRGERASG